MAGLTNRAKKVFKGGKSFLQKNDVNGFFEYLVNIANQDKIDLEEYLAIYNYCFERNIDLLSYYKGEQLYNYLSETDIVNASIPYGVKELRYECFAYCLELKRVQMPDTVKTIGEAAFEGCSQLEYVGFSDSVEIIDNYAFAGCTHLPEILLPKSVKYVGESAFSNCPNLTVKCEFNPENINWEDWEDYKDKIVKV